MITNNINAPSQQIVILNPSNPINPNNINVNRGVNMNSLPTTAILQYPQQQQQIQPPPHQYFILPINITEPQQLQNNPNIQIITTNGNLNGMGNGNMYTNVSDNNNNCGTINNIELNHNPTKTVALHNNVNGIVNVNGINNNNNANNANNANNNNAFLTNNNNLINRLTATTATGGGMLTPNSVNCSNMNNINNSHHNNNIVNSTVVRNYPIIGNNHNYQTTNNNINKPSIHGLNMQTMPIYNQQQLNQNNNILSNNAFSSPPNTYSDVINICTSKPPPPLPSSMPSLPSSASFGINRTHSQSPIPSIPSISTMSANISENVMTNTTPIHINNEHMNPDIGYNKAENSPKSKAEAKQNIHDSSETPLFYSCTICKPTRRFKHKCNLNAHKKIHGDNAIKCKYCNKRFARNSNLKQHIRYGLFLYLLLHRLKMIMRQMHMQFHYNHTKKIDKK